MSLPARIGAGTVVALTVVLVVLATHPRARPAFGLVSSDPADRATVTEAPSDIELIFTTAVDPRRSHLTVVRGTGPAVTSGGPRLVAPERLRQPVHVPAAGEVTIAYHVTSAAGAEAAGVLRFSARAGTPAAPGAGPPSAVPVNGGEAGHEHGVDPVSAGLLVLDGLVAVSVVVLLAARPRPSRQAR